MAKTVHVVGNGDQAHLYNKQPRKGLKLTCNLPPFPVADAYATIIVDFKFMAAMTEGSVWAPGDWILGFRPKMWMDKHPAFHMKFAKQVKEFYTKKVKLFEFFSDKMNQREFKEMEMRLNEQVESMFYYGDVGRFQIPCYSANNYNLSGTPLDLSLIHI